LSSWVDCFVTVLMDSNKFSTQVERLGVVETGRRRRWTGDEKLKIVLESMHTPRAIGRVQNLSHIHHATASVSDCCC
jgi:hypothetical protein